MTDASDDRASCVEGGARVVRPGHAGDEEPKDRVADEPIGDPLALITASLAT